MAQVFLSANKHGKYTWGVQSKMEIGLDLLNKMPKNCIY